MRRIEDPSNISLRCIKAIGKIATVQAERGDEEGVIKSINVHSTQTNRRPNSTDVTARVKRKDRPSSRVGKAFDREVRKEK